MAAPSFEVDLHLHVRRSRLSHVRPPADANSETFNGAAMTTVKVVPTGSGNGRLTGPTYVVRSIPTLDAGVTSLGVFPGGRLRRR